MSGPQRLLPCKAILFDSDGVLVDSEASTERAWMRWADTYGLDGIALYATVHGRRSADTVTRVMPPNQQVEALRRIDDFELEDAHTITAIPGSVELTRSMPPDRWAVVTSGTGTLAPIRLKAAGISAIPALVSADDVEHGKPEPDCYLRGAERLGLDPADCIVLEDAVSGVLAARAAGVSAVVGVGVRALETDADVVIADLRSARWSPEGLLIDTEGALR